MVDTEELLTRVHSSWRPVLEPHLADVARIADELSQMQEQGHRIAPPPENVLRALEVPLMAVRVLILGQDPYPTVGHATGWSFSVPGSVHPLPRSLQNIFRELSSDIGCVAPTTGDLSGWVDQGVLLLNRTLTVTVGEVGSHRHLGWQAVSQAIVDAIAQRGQPLVAILWGKDAQQLSSLFEPTAVIASAHPSPLSASRGFLGSRPFSRANALLSQQGAQPIDWCRTSHKPS